MRKLFSHSSIRFFSRLFRHGALRQNTFCFLASQLCYHTSLPSQEDDVLQSLISSVEDLYNPSLKDKQSSSGSSESFSKVKGFAVDAVSVSEKDDSHSVKRSNSDLSTTESESVSRVAPMLPDYVAECNRFMSVQRQFSSQESSAPQVQWKCCQCQRFSRIGVKRCIFCKSCATESHRKKFPPSRLITLFPPIWICEECGNTNASPLSSATPIAGNTSSQQSAQRRKFFCAKCNSPFKGVRKWTCSYCDSTNSRASPQCSSCFYVRRPGWKCKKCGGPENSIFTLQCLSCKAIRPSHLSAGTQLCMFCGESNDVRSELCEHCVAPLKELQSLLSSSPPFPVCAKPATLCKESSSCHAEGKGLAKTSRAEVPSNVSRTKVQNKPLVDTEGSWWCQNCNIVLRRNATFCDICLTPKGGTSIDEVKNCTKSLLSHETRPGDWQCPYCRQFKGMNVMSCCEKERESPAGYWLCRHCCSVNRNERHRCLGCDRVPSETTWKCKLCGSSNSVHVFACEVCFSPHPLLWGCSKCGKSHHYALSKCDCGLSKPDAPVPVLCPVCGAPNANKRKSCFRCRSRLFSDEWKCPECHCDKNARISYRCENCLSPRPFNKEGITWVCDVCSTTVDSGGDLPRRDQCPKCNSAYTSHCLKFPSRWVCRKCRLEANRSTSHTCMDCGQPRALRPFRCPAVCPHCLQDTDLTEKEICSRCGESLSVLLDTAGELVQGMETLPFAASYSC